MVSSVFAVVLVLVLNYQLVISNELAYFTKLNLPPNVSGPESLVFSTRGDEFYTGVADGRILKYRATDHALVDFATTSPLRTKTNCDGKNDANWTRLCGRPLGVAFRSDTGGLYITDIAYGLLVVGSSGGLATSIANSVNGVPFEFLDSVDIDPHTQTVYFTDAGAIFQSLNIKEIILSGDTSGKLLKYDPETNQVTLLLAGLSVANGVAVDRYGEFVLVTEYISRRIQRYWIKGPLADDLRKATFIPTAEALDTSYFMSRYVWNPETEHIHGGSDFDEMTETGSVSCSSSSYSNLQDGDGDEFGNLADFGGPTLDVKYSFSNFSFKNLSSLLLSIMTCLSKVLKNQ